MAKRRKSKIKSQSKSNIVRTEISTADDYTNPNVTLGPDSSLEIPSSGAMYNQDSTTAPDIGSPSGEEKYVASQWGLVDKYIFGKKYLPFTLVVIAIGWIIIQDNGAGKLENWASMWWTIQKCGVILGLFILILIVQWLYQKIFNLDSK